MSWLSRIVYMFLTALLIHSRTSVAGSALLQELRQEPGFSKNLLAPVATSALTNVWPTAIATDTNDAFYIAGSIHSDNETEAGSFAAREPSDTLGESDIFLIKMLGDGNLDFRKRMGSRSKDEALCLITDSKNNVYIGGFAENSVSEHAGGAAIFKYGSDGTRLWVQTYGSAGDTFKAMTITPKQDEIILTGSLKPTSSLHAGESKTGISTIFAMRIETETGTARGTYIATPFTNSVNMEGQDVILANFDGTERIFITGTSQRKTSSSQRVDDGFVIALTYPELTSVTSGVYTTTYRDKYNSIAMSTNDYSLYCIGSRYVDRYHEYDMLAKRLNSQDLTEGWKRTIGSVVFPNTASIVENTATENGVDMVMDSFGNMHILLQSSSTIPASGNKASTMTSRPAVVVLAPDGDVVDVLQYEGGDVVIPKKMLLVEDVVFFAGSVLNQETKATQAFMGGVALKDGTLQKHGEEFVPAAQDDAFPERNNTTPTGVGEKGVNVVAIVGGSVAGIAVLAAVGAVVLFTKRTRSPTSGSEQA